MYEFSVPMLYNKEHIDKLIEINNEVEKSRITSLYFSLPSTCELFTGFEQTRNQLLEKSNFSFWKELTSYSIENGFDVIYCLNMPRPLPIENPNFPKQIERLHKLLNELEKIGVKNLRVANPKLIAYINKYYPQFEILGSTASDFKIIQEFQFFHKIHPYVKEIVPSHNVNKNFKLLKNIKKLGIEVEVMVNEGCIQGCSNRFEHECTFMDGNFEIQAKEKIFDENFCKNNCTKIEKTNSILYLTKGNNIFPWEIVTYAKEGINKFKLTGRDGVDNENSSMLDNIFLYLKGVDNIKNIENVPVIFFAVNSSSKNELKNLTVKECKKYLPNINHYIKYGHLCSSHCGSECRYCYKCAEKIEKVFKKQQKREIPFVFR